MTMTQKIRNPHNFIPEKFNPKGVAIIGGEGSMGRRMAQEFFQDGYQVQITGEEAVRRPGAEGAREWKRNLRRWNRNVCKGADVVVFAVPIPILAEGADGHGLKNIFGRNPSRGWRDKLVIDICSTKVGAVRALAELKGATVIGTHPMFGPKLKSFAGQTVFACPVPVPHRNHVLQARMEVRFAWLKEFWERRGATVVETTPEEHDDFVPSVQFGVLLSALLYAAGLKETEANLGHVASHGTPNSRLLCSMLGRMISDSMLPTYVNLAFDNPKNLEWLDDTVDRIERLRSWMKAGNRNAVFGWMKELSGSQTPAFRGHFDNMWVFLNECIAKREFLTACIQNEADVNATLRQKSNSRPDIRAA
jgi:prephenate dehydrogenase